MSTINRASLVKLAADELNVSAVGQTVSPEDYDNIDGRIDGMLAELATRHVIYIGSADEIPSQYAEALGELLANVCAKSFGKPKDDSLREAMESRLRVMALRSQPTKNYLTTDPALEGTSAGRYSYNSWLRG